MIDFEHDPAPPVAANETRTLPPPAPRGRGAGEALRRRFTELEIEPDAEGLALAAEAAGDDEIPGPTTRFYRDASRSILATNDSPDVGFKTSVNPYRGCEH